MIQDFLLVLMFLCQCRDYSLLATISLLSIIDERVVAIAHVLLPISVYSLSSGGSRSLS